MSIHLDVVCIDPPVRTPEHRQNSVHVIGDIMPLVVAKYGIDRIDRDSEALRKPVQVPLG